MSEEFEGAGAEPTAAEVETADAVAQASDVENAELRMTDEESQDEASTESSQQRTGNHDVDRVLSSLDELEGKPVDDHVAVFERAHEQLRGALDGPRLPRP